MATELISQIERPMYLVSNCTSPALDGYTFDSDSIIVDIMSVNRVVLTLGYKNSSPLKIRCKNTAPEHLLRFLFSMLPQFKALHVERYLCWIEDDGKVNVAEDSDYMTVQYVTSRALRGRRRKLASDNVKVEKEIDKKLGFATGRGGIG